MSKRSKSEELLEAELVNSAQIVLYREGIFVKAFECSAYAVVTLVRDFKPSKKRYKVLGGAEMVSVGFPYNDEERHMSGMTLLERDENRSIYQLPEPIDLDAFQAWKESLPLHTTSQNRYGAKVASVAKAAAPYDSSEQIHLESKKTEGELIRAIRCFDLANSTPMECMQFVSELKELSKKYQ